MAVDTASAILSESRVVPLRAHMTGEQPGIQIIRFADVEAVLDTADLVENLLSDGGMSVVYGQSNSGKTFWATDLCLHIACGWEWCGRAVERKGVVYCAMEGGHGIRNRIAAFKTEYGLAGQNVPFGIVPVSLNMLDSADPQALVDAITAEAEAIGFPIGMIVVDTVARAIAGGNENAPDDMGLLIRHGDLIREATASHLMWIHHSGKDEAKGARGHSSLRAATDTEIEITASEGARVARVTKQREYECSGEFAFGLKVIELGQNQRGKTITSCVVEYGDKHTPGGVPVRRRLKGHTKRALEVLADLVATSGQEGRAGAGGVLIHAPPTITL
jgi:RecA-family ATPase